MRDTVQARYRERLALLAADSVLVAAVNRVTAPAEPAAPWRRVYGRFEPDRAPYAFTVFERGRAPQQIVTVEIFETRPADAADAQVVADAALGWISICVFPQDRKMPNLGLALRRAGDATVVRYRPGRRCTFRVDRGPESFFGKVFPDGTGQRLHEDAIGLWRAAARHQLGFVVAEPVAWDTETRTLWQRSIGGAPVYGRLADGDGPAFARRLGTAAGTLTRSSVEPCARFDAKTQCDRSRSYARELGTRVPSLAAPAAALVDALEGMHRDHASPLRPIHGAPHMNQWLDLGSDLGLVDFDRFSLGEPELDVCTFLGELDFEEGLARPVAEIEDAFIAGYEASSGPLDRQLLSVYRSHKRLAKALRSARALRPDGDARAERHFRTAEDALTCRGVS